MDWIWPWPGPNPIHILLVYYWYWYRYYPHLTVFPQPRVLLEIHRKTNLQQGCHEDIHMLINL